MKYIIIALISYVLGCGLGYLKGYNEGYDSAKEIYSSYYQKQINIYKELYEIIKEELLKKQTFVEIEL